MKSYKQNGLSDLRWHLFIGWLIVVGIPLTLLGVILSIWAKGAGLVVIALGSIPLAIAILLAVYAIILLTQENIKAIEAHTEKFDNLSDMLNKNRSILNQISRGVRLSDKAKSIVYRDLDTQALREAVFEKLHQEDYDSTYALIDTISKQEEYRQFGDQLRTAANKFRSATVEERINQVIAHIEKLFEQYQWPNAAVLIERLRKAFPDSEKAGELSSRLAAKKEHRKSELLAAWDEAVKRRENDRSLEILKELDLYLTPNEGLALQESARDVFKTRLHNLGVQFSLAVADMRWQQALETGEQIVRDFPNSRMAHEIMERLEILQEKAHQ